MDENLNDVAHPDAEDTGAASASAAPGLMYRAVYSTCYCVSFGVAWPVLFAARALPVDGAIRAGLRDGAQGAEQSSDQARARLAQSAGAVRNTAESCYAGVAQRVQMRVEAVQDAIAERRYRKRLGSSTV